MGVDKIKNLLGERMLAPWWRLRKHIEHMQKRTRLVFLRNRDFTLLSNNCFGGFVYRRYGLPYGTPTAGLFFMPDDFLRLLGDVKGYMGAELEFVSPYATPHWSSLSDQQATYGQYPVAKIKDVYVYFMHYATKEEAKSKWERRVKRINYDNMLVKFCDQNGATPEQIRAFDALPLANKVCFCAKPYPELKSVVVLSADVDQMCVRAETEENNFTRDYPITRVLNRMK